jgi:predicted RND superfamily exporter protein
VIPADEGDMVGRLPEWAVARPKLTITLAMALTAVFAAWLPGMRTDTDPKNMLPVTSEVRVFNRQVEEWFGLHEDMIAVGIVRDEGLFDRRALGAVARLTDRIIRLPGVVSADVTSLTTADNVVAESGTLTAQPLLPAVPATDQDLATFRRTVMDNPMAVGRLISADGRATAIYVPLEPDANGKDVADRIRALVAEERGDLRFYVAGDPVARDTFGAEMFRQMALFAPLAGALMMVALYVMFRNLALAFTIVGVAMMATIWSMGLLVAVGQPVHIMSSMMPVFLMAIATDSIHMFNEFYFRLREVSDRRRAVLDTIESVGAPVRYTALATAAGFAVLMVGGIVPVRVFGLFTAFGTIVIRLMSFSFIPAVMMLVSEDRLHRASRRETLDAGASSWLAALGRMSVSHPRAVAASGLVLLLVALGGLPSIRINNNMVRWFKAGSDVRVADAVINEKLGGSSLLYLTASGAGEDALKDPEALRYLEALQRDLEQEPAVGKTTSVVDLLKRINRVMLDDRPDQERIPDSRMAVGQYLFLFGMAAKPATLDTLLTGAAQRANIWVQLKTWDAVAVARVLDRVRAFEAAQPPPGLDLRPAGIAYFNLVWNHEVLRDMIRSFLAALIVVWVILTVSFRSWRWGLVSFVPLGLTILLIYGAIGYLGKDFDMPVSVLSALSLGMAVDFAIHFIRRYRQRLADDPDVERALVWTVARPGKGVLRNALLFSLAFSVMVFSSLTPYITVGVFIMAMMLLSAFFTLFYLPALIMLIMLFGRGRRAPRANAQA